MDMNLSKLPGIVTDRLLVIVEVPHCGWGWMSGLSRFPGQGSLCWCSGGWSWISSLWSAMKCQIVSFGVSMGLA